MSVLGIQFLFRNLVVFLSDSLPRGQGETCTCLLVAFEGTSTLQKEREWSPDFPFYSWDLRRSNENKTS